MSHRSWPSRRDVDVVLVDFSDTLGGVMLFGPTEELPAAWTEVYQRRFAQPGFNDRWQSGQIPTASLIAEFAHELGVDRQVVDAYVRGLCRAVLLRPALLSSVLARRRRREPQALVTVNPDIFDEVVRHHRLTEVFDQIVVSGWEGTIDKVELCRIALERLGRRDDLGSALLIDDSAANVEAFERRGGIGYRFAGDEAFRADVEAGRLPPCLRW